MFHKECNKFILIRLIAIEGEVFKILKQFEIALKLKHIL